MQLTAHHPCTAGCLMGGGTAMEPSTSAPAVNHCEDSRGDPKG